MIRRAKPHMANLPATILVAAILYGCSEPPLDDRRQAEEIIAAAIAHQGGNLLDRAKIEFDFRGRQYRILRDDGVFQYERLFEDSTGSVRDVVNNDEVFREIDGVRVELDSIKHRSVYVDVNSIVYFALLPYQLADQAVQPRHLGMSRIDSVDYHEIEVTFRQEGGGLDYEDRFVYWISSEPSVIGYLAYYYYTDGGGSRFRKAYNRRRVSGIAFADYLNYSAPVDSLYTDIHQFDSFYQSDSLTLVSEINLDDIRVDLLTD